MDLEVLEVLVDLDLEEKETDMGGIRLCGSFMSIPQLSRRLHGIRMLVGCWRRAEALRINTYDFGMCLMEVC